MSGDQVKLYAVVVLTVVGIWRSPRIARLICKWGRFVGWKILDLRKVLADRRAGRKVFPYFGVRCFCGRQGGGKTMALVWQLEEIRRKYPRCHIYTNFDYVHQTAPLQSLNDILRYRNGDDGVVFAIDELQNEFSSASSRDFPESLLSVVTMQRKQKICILCTSQVFGRLAKPLREQCYEVVECRTFAGRWTRIRCYDADDYNRVVDNPNPELKFKLPKLWRTSFVQTDDLRNLYDSYAVVERLSRDGFAAKDRRVS